MQKIVYVTSNKSKAKRVQSLTPFELEIVGLEVDEIQSVDPKVVVEHKVRQAYVQLQRPVLIEDTSLAINALGGMPGALIKWFIRSMELETICRLVDPFDDRSAAKRNVFAFFDGEKVLFFEGVSSGTIAEHPRGTNGFGFDPIYIPDGQDLTHAEMTPEVFEQYANRKVALVKLNQYLKKEV